MRVLSGRNLALLAFTILAFVGTIALSDHIRSNRITVPESYSDEDLDLQGKRLKGYSLGAEGLIADWYWMRSLQYVGDKIVNAKEETINIDDLNSLNPRLLYPLLDNATDLDPKFINAFVYGAVVLPTVDPNLAIKLTEKGIAQNPDEWRLYQYLGFIYWKLKQYDKAADVYERGSKVPGAPPFLKLMAGMMETRGGGRDAARTIYGDMYKNGSDSWTQHIAELRLQWLDSLDERDVLDAALASYKKTNARCAANFSEILPILRTTPYPAGVDIKLDRSGQIIDPSGAPYTIDQNKCVSSLGPDSQLPKD
ncbi:MAG TPA: tetratricopeptide repeat protein [Pyrinomonadaceae bacterium]